MSAENTSLDRRSFLRGGAAAGIAVATTGLAGLFQRCAPPDRGDAPSGDADSDYGPPVPMTPVAAGEGADLGTMYLALPEGFSYTVFGVEGSRMSDGNLTPRAHDGMAAFLLPDGRVRLVRNHEDRSTAEQAAADGGALADPHYDRVGRGGTTTLEIAVGSRAPMPDRDFLSLTGTIVNCAGGPTPWGAWLTCEETTQGEEQGWGEDHGYVFEVPAGGDRPAAPVPLKGMGRFVHEAVAVDPATGFVYETEDRGSAGFYRYRPKHRDRLRAGGRLQMLMVEGDHGGDLRRRDDEGANFPVRWVDIPDPDPTEAGSNPLAVYEQGHARGGATFSRLEGCWWGNGAVYLNSTNGGSAGWGQVWEYRPSSNADAGELTLLVVADEAGVLDGPDNITVSGRGGLLVCEDGSGAQYLRGVLSNGETYDFAHNELNDREWAGACFVTSSAFRERLPETGGQILFVNIQGDTRPDGPGNLGHTFAIWGPWTDGSL